MKAYFFRACLAGVLLSSSASICRADQDWDARARELVGKMTLSEKIMELHGIQDSEYYRYVPPIPRLGIPAFHIANGPAGVGPAGDDPQKPATALPSPLSLASSWDVTLAKEYGVILGKESKDLNEDLLESPDINIARVPQNGRTFEAFGEDPYLVSQLSVAEIDGIQGQGEIANVNTITPPTIRRALVPK